LAFEPYSRLKDHIMNTDNIGSASIQPSAPSRAPVQADARPVQVAPAAPPKGPEKSATKALSKQSEEQLKEAVKSLNEQSNTSMSFSIDKTNNRTVIKVEDANTGEVIRQIPNETVLRVSHNIEKAKGLFLDEKR
jgi:flagellar protein FlaG